MTTRTGHDKQIQPRIRQYRLAAGLSQAAVAEAIQAKKQLYSVWEIGLCYPSTVNLFKLARFFGCSPADLYPELAAAMVELIPEPAAAGVGGR